MGDIENEISNITSQIQSLTTQISNLSTSTSSSGSNGIGSSASNIIGKVNTDTSYSEDNMKQAKQRSVSDIVNQMRTLSAQWHVVDKATQKQLADDAYRMGTSLAQFGVVADRDESSGVWYIKSDLLDPANAGKLLYNCYHTGGFVGGEPLKPNEEYIKAEKGELVLTSSQQDSFAAQIDKLNRLVDAFSESVAATPVSMDSLWPGGDLLGGGSVSNVTTTNSPTTINIGDTTINCAPEQSVEAHQKISRDVLNEIARQIRKP